MSPLKTHYRTQDNFFPDRRKSVSPLLLPKEGGLSTARETINEQVINEEDDSFIDRSKHMQEYKSQMLFLGVRPGLTKEASLEENGFLYIPSEPQGEDLIKRMAKQPSDMYQQMEQPYLKEVDKKRNRNKFINKPTILDDKT
mmetsp:Transcript_26166/g.25346  ORF Transcript_26166/g.25346 Transcript_26166/m.25346 type:complete len:142 (+) Transcript_26166:1850-2275(+)